MPNAKGLEKIIIVDDEWESPIVTAVRRRLDEEGWQTLVIVPELSPPFHRRLIHA